MATIHVDFDTISRSQGLFKFPSELHLDDRYQHIIHSTIKKYIIDSHPVSEEKQRLESVIESKLEIEFELASIRQDPIIVDFEVAEKVLKSRAHI